MNWQGKIINILFLTSTQTSRKISTFMKNSGHHVTEETKIVETLSNYDLVVSFGYKYIISNYVLSSAKRPPLNLHISFLPFNRGFHPNFWAHFEGTPSGISIHLIDSGIDTGEILYRKRIDFDTNQLTFRQTWIYLNSQIEKLFVDNFNSIVKNKITPIKQEGQGTFHLSTDLPQDFLGWDSIISYEIKRLKTK
jgi:methionyl-tRNA formyltransferase